MNQLLQRWNKSYPDELYEQLPKNWERRQFLFKTAKAAAGLAATPALMQLAACQRGGPPQVDLNNPPWPTVAAVQNVLFPADGIGPSAHDIQATRYLQLTLQNPDFDTEERKFILDGVTWLDQFAQEKYQSPFLQLDSTKQEAVLRSIVQSTAGDRWVSALLTYVIEALLCDPVYGGNPNEIGWKWLQHPPGFPRPREPYYLQPKL